MKIIKIFPVIACMFILLLSSCKETYEINYNVIPGNYLYTPTDGSTVDLTTGVRTTFEWAPSIAEDNGYIAYEVLFDKIDGDFSNPVATYASSLTGSSTYLTMEAITLNTVAGAAGIESSGEGELKWTVRASKALFGSIYSQAYTLKVIRMRTMSPLPETVTLYGSATEDPDNGIPMILAPGIDDEGSVEGTFECFTQLSTSGEFTVVDDLGRYYALNSDGSMTYSETAVQNTAPGDGIYWLTLTFDGMIWSYSKISRIDYYAAAWANSTMTTDTETLTYVGKGVWELTDYPNEVSVNDAGDTRHRFNMHLEDGSRYAIGVVSGQSLGSSYTTDYLKAHIYSYSGVGNWDWDMTWYFLSSDCGVPFDCYLYMNADNVAGAYYHEYIFNYD